MEKYEFLSDEWFAKCNEIVESMGELEIPEALVDLNVNVLVKADSGDTEFSIQGGNFVEGHTDAAVTKLTLPEVTAKELFVKNDSSAAMSAFMAGKLKIEGDMSKIMVLSSVQPSSQQLEVREQVLAITQ